jgi:hypothetical protein
MPWWGQLVLKAGVVEPVVLAARTPMRPTPPVPPDAVLYEIPS